MRDRRGPATVTGDANRKRLRAAATGPPRADREGAVRSARKPGDLPPTTKPRALVEGVAHPDAQVPRRPGGRRRAAAAAPGALAARTSTCGSRATDATLVPRTTVTTSPGSFSKDGDPGHQCSSTSAGRRARARDRTATGSGQWFDFGDYGVQTIKGEHHAFEPRSGAAATGRSGSTTATRPSGVCSDAELQDGRRRAVLPELLRRVLRRAEPLRDHLGAAVRAAGPGRSTVTVVEYAATFDGSTPVDDRGAGRGRDGHRRRARRSPRGRRRGRGDRRPRAAWRACGRRSDGLRPLGDRARVRRLRRAALRRRAAAARRRATPPRRPRPSASVRDGAVYSRRRAPRLLRGTRDRRSVRAALGQAAADAAGRGQVLVLLGPPRALPPDALRARLVLPHRRPGRVVLPAAEAARRAAATCSRSRPIDGAFNRGAASARALPGALMRRAVLAAVLALLALRRSRRARRPSS